MSKKTNVKTITVDEFETLISEGKWVISDRGYTIKSSHYDDDEGAAIIWGYAWETRTLDGVSIIYTETFYFKKGDPDSFRSDSDGIMGHTYPATWEIEGVRVVEEDFDGEMVERDGFDLSYIFPRRWKKINLKEINIDFDPDQFGATKDERHIQYSYLPGNWVIEKKDSGKAVMETHNPEVFEAFGEDLFRLRTVEDWLVEVNKREDAGCASAA